MEKFLFEDSNFFSQELIALLQKNFLIMPNWKWLVLFAAIFAAIILRPITQYLLKGIKQANPWPKKFPKSFTAYLFRTEIERPLSWAIITLLLFTLSDVLEFKGKFELYYEHILKGFLAFHLIHLAYHAVDSAGSVFGDIVSKSQNQMVDNLVPFATKILKAIVVVLGFLIVLQSFGLNVMSLLAGLGLGGLALALAAQDTAANLFGSVTILIDSPCKIGDWVKIKDVEGTVEEIGFRSTRIRTFYNSVITIPNGAMAKENIDNMGMRPARRVRQVLGLTYDTQPDKIIEFCHRVRGLITMNEKVIPETVVVHFNNFSASSLDVLVNFHLQVFTGPEELEQQQKIFMGILEIAKQIKVDFAYPTQTVYNHDVKLN
jgi:MscS family membrane protein